MPDQHFVIDGSNIATEGRTSPSFAQLKEALAAFRGEHPDATVTLVVDASFEHRIDDSETVAFQRAEARGDLVSPPAGAIGRGDGFLLQIADRTGATVVSNDSFQEFHGQYEWLFQVGRLIGGKPVPGVGWIFSLRSPVRGARSRKAVREAEKADKEQRPKRVTSAIAEATRSAIEGSTPRSGRSRRRRSSGPPPVAVNEPAPFLQFVIDHRPGMSVEGRVAEFASHGAFVDVDGVRCYLPLSAMGDPPPSRAREVLSKGETKSFVVQAIDAPRRGIELAIPGYEQVAGAASDETVEAETEAGERAGRQARRGSRRPASRGPTGAPATGTPAAAAGSPGGAAKGTAATGTAPARKTGRPAAAGKPAAGRATPAKAPAGRTTGKAPGVGKAGGGKRAAATTAARRPPARPGAKAAAAAAKVPGGSAPAKGTPAKAGAGKSTARKAPAKKSPAAKTPAGKTPGGRIPAKKTPADKVPGARTPARKVSAAKTPAKGTPAKKTPAGRAPTAAGAKKTPARKTAARKSPGGGGRSAG